MLEMMMTGGGKETVFLYVAYGDWLDKIDMDGNTIWTYDAVTSNIRCVTVDENGLLFVGASARVKQLDSDTGAFIKEMVTDSRVDSIVVDASGFVHVGDSGGKTYKFDFVNEVIVQSATIDSGSLHWITVDEAGHAYITTNDDRFYKMRPDYTDLGFGEDAWLWTDYDGVLGYDGVTLGSDGSVYTCAKGRLRKHDPLTGNMDYELNLEASGGLSSDSEGHIYYCKDGFSANVTKCTLDGTTVWASTQSATDIAVSPEGDVYCIDMNSTGENVVKLDSSGNYVWGKQIAFEPERVALSTGKFGAGHWN